MKMPFSPVFSVAMTGIAQPMLMSRMLLVVLVIGSTSTIILVGRNRDTHVPAIRSPHGRELSWASGTSSWPSDRNSSWRSSSNTQSSRSQWSTFGDWPSSSNTWRSANDLSRQANTNLSINEARSVSLVETTIPFYRPREYSIQPIESFVLYDMCTDISFTGCNPSNTVRFTTATNPSPVGFRYHSTGPAQMQGVFWTQQNAVSKIFGVSGQNIFPSSKLVSFAQTRHGMGVHTGVLQTDSNGYEYVVRALGDHTWATNSIAPSDFLSSADALYLYDLKEGTLTNPLRFEIIPSFKLGFDCLRFNFGQLTSLAVKFEQILVTDPESPYLKQFPGSTVWLRRTTYLGFLVSDYLSVQVVNGSGLKIFPAWSKFIEENKVLRVAGLVPDTESLNDRITCSF